MTIAIALCAALVYGASDFCGGLATRRAPAAGVIVWSQGLGLVLLAIVVPLLGGTPAGADVGWGALCGLAGAIATAALYRGLAIGTMGIVSPITAVLAAAMPVVFGMTVRGERPTALACAGVVAALIAVVCVSAAPGDANQQPARTARTLPPGVGEALISGVAFGVFFIALAQTRSEAGMYPLLFARITSFSVLIIGSIAIGGVAAVRVPRATVWLVAVCGAFDASANVLYVLAAHRGMLTIAAVLTSLYPASTIILAAIVLRERLARMQWAGVVLALAGVVAISVP